MQVLPGTSILPAITHAGRGRVAELLTECSRFGDRGVLVHGVSLRESGAFATITGNSLAGLAVRTYEHAGGEPSLSDVSDLLAASRAHGADWVAGVGGGSVLDLAKACAGLFHARLEPVLYHDGQMLEEPGIPFVAVPTTAGTGSEATTVSVITNRTTGVKKSIRHASFMARVIVLDPGLLASCPRLTIAHAGMDAFTQAVESYSSTGATWLSDAVALKSLGLVSRCLPSVFADPVCESADDMIIGSYLAGVALGLARLGLVHGLAHPLGARYGVPHGLACAVCLPYVLEMNRVSLGTKYDEMSDVAGEDLLARTRSLLDDMDVRSPFKGKPVVDRQNIIRETLASGSTAANPRPVSEDDVEFVLGQLFGSDQ